MTRIQRIAQLSGWVLVVLGVWGMFVTTSMEADPATAGRLWGLFPVNLVHNLIHLAAGVWGIVAARGHPAARSYAVLAGALFIILAVLGLFFPHGLGLVPLGGADLWLHAFLGVALLVAGLTITGRGGSTVAPPRLRTVPPPTDPGGTP